jgi:16S rRNA (uracil1498-N3)-methyltransferase
MPRFYCDAPLASSQTLELPPVAARHAQVLRLQPGDAVTLFNGQGGEFDARITRMGRSSVDAEVGAHHPLEREAARAVTLAVGMPANERMDWLVEKATELGVAAIWPLLTERCVLRLKGERADKKQAHWQAIAVAACEQCGRNRVPRIHAVTELAQWLQQPRAGEPNDAYLLSLRPDAQPLRAPAAAAAADHAVTFLSGPEGGLSSAEEAAAIAAGLTPASLGQRVLRAETAALAVLAMLTLRA